MKKWFIGFLLCLVLCMTAMAVTDIEPQLTFEAKVDGVTIKG